MTGASSSSEGDGDPAPPWGEQLDLPERVIVVPSPPEAIERRDGPDDAGWDGGLAQAVGLDRDEPSTEAAALSGNGAAGWEGPPTEAAGAVATTGDDAPGWEGPPTEAAGAVAATGDDVRGSDTGWEGPPTEAVELSDPGEHRPSTWVGPPTEAVELAAAHGDRGAISPAAVRPTTGAGRDETDPGALRPSAPEPVSVRRGPSRSRRVVSRLRAFVGLLLVVILSGVGLAAAIGAAVLLVAFVLKRAFGS